MPALGNVLPHPATDKTLRRFYSVCIAAATSATSKSSLQCCCLRKGSAAAAARRDVTELACMCAPLARLVVSPATRQCLFVAFQGPPDPTPSHCHWLLAAHHLHHPRAYHTQTVTHRLPLFEVHVHQRGMVPSPLQEEGISCPEAPNHNCCWVTLLHQAGGTCRGTHKHTTHTKSHFFLALGTLLPFALNNTPSLCNT